MNYANLLNAARMIAQEGPALVQAIGAIAMLLKKKDREGLAAEYKRQTGLSDLSFDATDEVLSKD